MNLRGKTAVVTGSATNIGQGIALKLAECGANVAVTYNNAPADETKTLIKEAGGNAIAVHFNATDQESVANLFKTANETFGGVDILVNNSALQYNKWLLEYTEEEYDNIMDVNLMGYFRCTREAIPYLKKSSAGRIINITSIHAKRPAGFDPVYAMTKSAIQLLTYETAIETASYGITANAVALGAVKVASRSGGHPFRPWKDLPRREMPYGRYLSRRMGVPADAGYIAAFLASDESRYITGSSIRADGGTMLITV